MSGDYEQRDVTTLLHDAVDDVEPRGSLAAIRARTADDRRRRGWQRGAGAVAATAAVVAGIAVVGGLPHRTGPAPAPPPASERKTSPWVVPVYYVGDTGAGPRLFRERHLGPPSGDGDKDLDALRQAVDGGAFDSDYRSLWPTGTHVDSLAYERGRFVVRLSGDDLARRPSSVSREEARLSVQQLVWTAQAVTGRRALVQLEIAGSSTSRLLGVPVTDPLAAADADSVLAPVSVDRPAQQRGRVPTVRNPVTVTGHASAFEGTVQWRLTQGDRVVRRGFATARECCTLAPYSFHFTAPPGDYVLTVSDQDVSDGEGGGTSSDDKPLRIER